MAKKKSKKIELANCNSIRFPVVDKVENDMLIIGNFDGIFGSFIKTPTGNLIFNPEAGDALRVSGKAVIRTIQSKRHVYLLSTEETAKYFMNFLTICRDKGFFNSVGRSAAIKKYFHYSIIDLEKDDNEIIDCVNNRLFNNLNNMKFDCIIQNPPYTGSGNLYIDFISKGLDIISENGKMIFIVPATWLINVLKTGDAKMYDAIKSRISGHVVSVNLENKNDDFGTHLKVPFVILTIDMSKTYEDIDYVCCGERRVVKSIYDCNLIGDYDTIWSILNKVQGFGNMMKSHTTNKNMGDGVWYAKYPRVISANFCGGGVGRFNSDEMYRKHNGHDFYLSYTAPGFHSDRTTDIQNYPCEKRDKGGKKIENSIAENIYGTKEELENWKYFIFNNKLPLFINIVLTYCQDNHSKPYLPWLVDKRYTDEEINKLFGFTDEEIALIDRTIKKYERNSPWFKRYMCGPDSVSDEEVNNFIKTLDE